ncbi:MAG: DUF7670 domain-containing protein, partial [Planctomycetota bacterium]
NIITGIGWVVRILASLLVILVLVIFIGEALIGGGGPGNPFKHPLPVQLEFVGMLAIFVGLIIGWKWQVAAGLLIIGGMMIFHIVQGKIWLNWVFGLFDITGILFILYWLLKRKILSAKKYDV